MSLAEPKISIIIATYKSGDGLYRVINSLDEQTLPQDEFEVIFVDDGSPDDTFERLQELEAERANVRAFRIENSGWPSKPRNLGIEQARGEYLFFMDHDDSVFPNGLQRAYEYAVETNADLLSPKESKTNDKWWGISSLREGNLPNIAGGEGISHLLPLVPHKLYRRSMVMEHDIRFPEGSRVLWEDQFVNIDAYRHADVVAVLADTPVYLWHGSDGNTSHTFNPAKIDFWDRLDELMVYIDQALQSPEHQDARRLLIAFQLRVRVIDRMVRLLTREKSVRSELALRRARDLLRRFGTPDVIATLPRKQQIQAGFLRKGKRDRLVGFHEHDLAGGVDIKATSLTWRDGVLQLELETTLAPKDAEHPILASSGEQVQLSPPKQLARKIRSELLDVSDQAESMAVGVVVRSRRGYVTWPVPSSVREAEFVEGARGLSLRVRSTARLDIRTLACGHPLEENVWDVFAKTEWLGMARSRPVAYEGDPAPGLVTGGFAIPYANNSGALSVDTAGWLRSLVSDAEPVSGPAGSTHELDVELANLAANSDVDYRDETPFMISASAPESNESTLKPEVVSSLSSSLQVTLKSEGGKARMTAKLAPTQGSYRVFALREGVLNRTRHSIEVDEHGAVRWVVDD